MSSSSHIPNLKTLLGRGRGGGGLRGRARGGAGTSGGDGNAARDNAVRGTDQDAAGSRASCVELGYLDDPYAKLFATQPSTRRLPLLNRGTYVRTSAIDTLVDRFLTTPTPTPKQIVSLGAGTDTRYFRLRDRHPTASLVYHELDFASNTSAKLSSIARSQVLLSHLDTSTSLLDPSQSAYHSSTYNLHALDLRSLAETTTAPPSLPNLDPSLPTLLLSEMCLVYIDPQTVTAILTTLTTHYLAPSTPAALVLYEPIRPHDAFGRTMIANLATRNIRLPTLSAYPELRDQRARLTQYGFTGGCGAADTAFIWREWVAGDEKERVGALEMLDELEELELLLKHYGVFWAWRDGAADGEGGQGDVFGRAWEGVREVQGG